MPIIPAFRRLRQKDYGSEASLGNTADSNITIVIIISVVVICLGKAPHNS